MGADIETHSQIWVRSQRTQQRLEGGSEITMRTQLPDSRKHYSYIRTETDMAITEPASVCVTSSAYMFWLHSLVFLWKFCGGVSECSPCSFYPFSPMGLRHLALIWGLVSPLTVLCSVLICLEGLLFYWGEWGRSGSGRHECWTGGSGGKENCGANRLKERRIK